MLDLFMCRCSFVVLVTVKPSVQRRLFSRYGKTTLAFDFGLLAAGVQRYWRKRARPPYCAQYRQGQGQQTLQHSILRAACEKITPSGWGHTSLSRSGQRLGYYYNTHPSGFWTNEPLFSFRQQNQCFGKKKRTRTVRMKLTQMLTVAVTVTVTLAHKEPMWTTADTI